jgi:hypothetical protein
VVIGGGALQVLGGGADCHDGSGMYGSGPRMKSSIAPQPEQVPSKIAARMYHRRISFSSLILGLIHSGARRVNGKFSGGPVARFGSEAPAEP